MRFFIAVELVNALEPEKAKVNAEQLACRLVCADLVMLDELGYLPFRNSKLEPALVAVRSHVLQALAQPCARRAP